MKLTGATTVLPHNGLIPLSRSAEPEIPVYYAVGKCWAELWLEEFREGMTLSTRSRTVTPSDVDLFASLTWAVNPIFLSDEVARSRGLPGRVAPGALTLSYAIGLLYQTGVFDHIQALTRISEVEFKSPVRPGDEISVEAEVVEVREVRQDAGAVTLRFRVQNLSSGRTSLTGSLTVIVLKSRPQGSK
ncbi:MAG: MaoC/PaaZ C-terminal domain-containing protein [Nitrososphaerota archaeon]|nr:MaoC/PaaZ C-terminal domain-containing protein [Candidatus Calditenuis fumarioli]